MMLFNSIAVLMLILNSFYVGICQVNQGKIYGEMAFLNLRRGCLLYQQSESYVDRQMVRLDSYLKTNSMFLAIKRVDPAAHERFRLLMRKKLEAGGRQEDLDIAAAKFGKDFAQGRLKHASPSVLKKYLQLRLSMLEGVQSEAPEALYTMLVTGDYSTVKLPVHSQKKVLSVMTTFTNRLADIITAPLANTPLQQNEVLVKQRWAEALGRLTDEELEAVRNEGKPNVNQTAYCRAYFRVYRELLKLPDAESVQVFRYLRQIPFDDRLNRQ